MWFGHVQRMNEERLPKQELGIGQQLGEDDEKGKCEEGNETARPRG